ncbi:MAG TPA: penicillin-binding protein 2 [Candidatus Saccharimonadales bacterium]|nr:penicillin-binding protein 2 [Candidatus Saccharimonadales bacterium]
MGILGAVFVIRLFFLQVVLHDHYEAEANREHVSKFAIVAKRGQIYAHDGKNNYAAMVLNEPTYLVFADPRFVKDHEKVENTLRRIAGGNLVEKFEEGLRDEKRQYVVVARGLNKSQADLLKKEKLESQGVGLQESEKRVYPENQLAAQVLGFVNGEGHGQYGIEEGMDNDLSGKDGQLKAITDVHGIPISIGPESVQTPPQNGKNLVLTIDRNIQNKVEQALKSGLERSKATKGSIVVMDPNNGKILAMANAPTYNPNDYAKTSDYTLFQNRIVSDPYEPGSVIKALTMGIGLNEGKIQPGTTYNNTGSLKIDDATIRNVLTSPTGQVSMTQVLLYSFNTGAVWVLQQLGGSGEINAAAKEKLYGYFTRQYLFGERTGIELAGEAKGIVLKPDASNVTYANMTFGQGVNMSMLQVAGAFSAAINDGVYYVPQVVDGYLDDAKNYVDKAPHVKKSDVISPDASAKLRQMLHEARVGGPVAAGEKKGYYTGGKTGTAEVYDPKTGRYDEKATIGSYLGFGGQDRPQYVIMVRVDDATIAGYSGSAAAAPIFTDISNWMLDYLQIAPKG